MCPDYPQEAELAAKDFLINYLKLINSRARLLHVGSKKGRRNPDGCDFVIIPQNSELFCISRTDFSKKHWAKAVADGCHFVEVKHESISEKWVRAEHYPHNCGNWTGHAGLTKAEYELIQKTKFNGTYHVFLFWFDSWYKLYKQGKILQCDSPQGFFWRTLQKNLVKPVEDLLFKGPPNLRLIREHLQKWPRGNIEYI